MNLMKIGQGYGGTRYSVTVDLEKGKTIDYVAMRIDGYDSRGGGFYGAIRDVIFFGVSK